MMNCTQPPDSKQTVQTRPFAQQLQPSRQQSRLHHIRQTRLKQVAPFCAGDFCCACMMSTNVGVDTATAAARRRQRRLRSWLRHERMTVAMTLAEKLHHTSRGQKLARVGEEVVHDAHDAPRGPKTPPLGVRPGSLAEPAPQRRDRSLHLGTSLDRHAISINHFTTSARLVRNAATFAAGIPFNIVLTAL